MDGEIKYIGLRLGENLYEELITAGEGIVPTRHEKIMVLRAKTCLAAACAPAGELLAAVRELVPEYCEPRRGE